jgi:outer membrane lipoprotein-sorting protein
MRKVILFTLLGLACAVQAAPMSQSDIEQLVQKLQALHQSEPSIEANFREERHTALLKDPLVSQGKVWFTLPDKVRREVSGSRPSTTIIDGNKMSIYYPSFQQLEVYDLAKRPMLRDSIQAIAAGLNFQKVTSYYNIEGSKEGNVYRLVLTPKTSNMRRLLKSVDLTIDQNLSPTEVQVLDAKGEKVLVNYSNVHRGSVPDSTFQFTPPAGTTVTTPLGS